MSPALKSLRRRLAFPVGLLLATHAFGTLGFYWCWHDQGGTLMDALFMTFTTVTTIGFSEGRGLDTIGRLVAMLVAAGGIGSLFYTFTLVLEFVGSTEFQTSRKRRRMQRDIDQLKGHYVVAGFGRVGRETTAELQASHCKVVVIDPRPEIEAVALEAGCFFLQGDAADDDVLRRAGVPRAQGVVVTADSDATNLYVVLSTRLLNPTVFIASRAIDERSVPKLIRAGANRAISPYAIGGKRLAHLALSPGVVDFFETALRQDKSSLSIREVVIAGHSSAVGKSLAALRLHEETGAWLLAVLREGNALVHPKDDVVLSSGDHVLALGTPDQLTSLQQLVARPT